MAFELPATSSWDAWVLPAWEGASSPGVLWGVSDGSLCSLVEKCVLHPLLEGNSQSLWVCCGANKLPLFLPTLKYYKKQQSGQVTASWEESHKSEHNGRRGNCICAPGTLPVWASFERCAHTQTTNTHKHTNVRSHVLTRVHTHTHSPINPQKCSICSSFSLKGYIQTTDGWATSQCSKASSQILMHPTKVTEQKSRHMHVIGPLILLEIPKSTLLSL